MKWHEWLEVIVKHPVVQLSMGILLLIVSLTGFIEVWNPHHSVAIIGIFYVSQALPNVLQSLERIAKGLRK